MEEILRILENNGRIDASQISELTGLKEEEVRELITKYESKIVDYEKSFGTNTSETQVNQTLNSA